MANTAQGEAECCDPTPSAVFYCTTRLYGAFTDLLVLHGRINKYFFVVMAQCDAFRQVSIISR